MNAPQFTREELWNIMDDADSSLLNKDGALDNPGHWLGLVKDLARQCLHELGVRTGHR